LGSSKTLEAGVDTKLEEGEVGILDRGELEEEAGSPTPGRYGLSWVFMGLMQTHTGMDEGVYVQYAGLLYSGRKNNIRN
jgi:hypothetical protein